MKNLILLALLISLSYVSFGMDAYNLSSTDSKIGFEIIKFKIGAPVNGEFKDFSGTAHYDKKNKVLSNSSALIKVASIDTGNTDRNNHLLTDENFFDEKSFKEMTFKQIGKTKLEKGAVIKGLLTIKGKSKNASLVVKSYRPLKNGVKINAIGSINRLDYRVSWNAPLEKSKWKKVLGKLGKFVIDTEVKIILNAKFIK